MHRKSRRKSLSASKIPAKHVWVHRKSSPKCLGASKIIPQNVWVHRKSPPNFVGTSKIIFLTIWVIYSPKTIGHIRILSQILSSIPQLWVHQTYQKEPSTSKLTTATGPIFFPKKTVHPLFGKYGYGVDAILTQRTFPFFVLDHSRRLPCHTVLSGTDGAKALIIESCMMYRGWATGGASRARSCQVNCGKSASLQRSLLASWVR